MWCLRTTEAGASFTPLINQSSHQGTVQPTVMRYQGYPKSCDCTSNYTTEVTYNRTHSIFYRFHGFLVVPLKGKMAKLPLHSLPNKNIHTMTITTAQIEIRIQKCYYFLTWHLSLTYLNVIVRTFTVCWSRLSMAHESWCLHVFPTPYQWIHVGNLKLAMVRVFLPGNWQKLQIISTHCPTLFPLRADC